MYAAANVAHGLVPYDGTIEDNVKRLAALPLLFRPGERWEYSLGVDVLGRLVEVVSGKPLDEFFRTRIFEPLGMKDTYFYPPEDKLQRLAADRSMYPSSPAVSRQRLNPFSGHSDCRRTLRLFRRLSLP